MATRVSAGFLLYRFRAGQLEVFLAHPGGPYFARKDDGYWSIPKGEVETGEPFLQTARRELQEEVGFVVPPEAAVLELGCIRQKGGKIVHAWGTQFDRDEPIRSNLVAIEWPPHSGVHQDFPEIDRAAFFRVAIAARKLKATQVPFLDRLQAKLRGEVIRLDPE